MVLEIEAKIKVEQLTGYADRLEQLHASFDGQVVQRDHFFDRPDRSLRTSDSGLRVRQVTSDSAGQDALICFKGPRQPGQYKSRQEIEFSVSSASSAKELLTGLGFEVTLIFEKRRRLWRLDRYWLLFYTARTST